VPENQHRRRWRYAERRLELFDLLGSVCVDCGEDRPDMLSIDHINGRTYEPRELSSRSRLARYIREARAGEVTVRCISCNSSRGCPGRYASSDPDPEFYYT